MQFTVTAEDFADAVAELPDEHPEVRVFCNVTNGRVRFHAGDQVAADIPALIEHPIAMGNRTFPRDKLAALATILPSATHIAFRDTEPTDPAARTRPVVWLCHEPDLEPEPAAE